ncbi:MAG: outer membrane beta-barrel protein [Bacteroidia bacterium]
MDDKQFDRLLKGKLESFHDTGPVDEAGMGNVFAQVDAISRGIPWYLAYKPYLVAAGISLLVISSAFAFWIYQKQDARIEALEKQVVDLKENVKDEINPGPTISPTPQLPQNQSLSPETIVHSPVIHPQTYAYQQTYTSDSSHKTNNPQQPTRQIFNQVTTIAEWGNLSFLPPRFDLLQPSLPLLTDFQSGLSSDMEEQTIEKDEKEQPKINFASRIRVGVGTTFLKPNPDIGKAQANMSPGIVMELKLTDQLRLNITPGFNRRSYAIQNPERFRPKIERYPRLPNLNETQVAEIKVVTRMVRLPVELNYVFGSSNHKIRPYAGAGIVGNLQFSQDFTYRRGGNDFHPGARIDKRNFALAGMSIQTGAEIRLAEKSYARLGLFYEQPLKSQGAEQRKFSAAGISASLWFAGS